MQAASFWPPPPPTPQSLPTFSNHKFSCSSKPPLSDNQQTPFKQGLTEFPTSRLTLATLRDPTAITQPLKYMWLWKPQLIRMQQTKNKVKRKKSYTQHLCHVFGRAAEVVYLLHMSKAVLRFLDPNCLCTCRIKHTPSEHVHVTTTGHIQSICKGLHH